MSVVLSNVTKLFGQVRAVDDLSFAIRPGEVTGLLGPNGAGKTTTVRLISGYLTPSSGRIEVDGQMATREAVDVRRKIGYLPEGNPLYLDMNVVDYLEFTAGLYGVLRSDRSRRVHEMVGMFGLESVKHRRIGKLSRGYRQRVGIAQTLVHDPEILIYDEPTTGLDPNQVIEFRRFIGELGKEKTVIFSTHNLAEVQALCNRVIIMSRGKTLADGSISSLQQEFQGGMQFFVAIEVDETTTVQAIKSALESVRCVKGAIPLEQGQDSTVTKTFYVESECGSDLVKEVYSLCVAKEWVLVDVQRRSTKIEDIFHQLTKGKLS